MTYEESNALSIDATFRGRIKIAALKFTSYVFAEDPNSQGHAARYRWAQLAAQQPEMQAAILQPNVVIDPAVQAQGGAISDAELQVAVEGVINRFA